MGGIGQLVQIDEWLFRGKRKYHRARLLLDNRHKRISTDLFSKRWLGYQTQTNKNRNYGTRTDGETLSNSSKLDQKYVLRSRDFWHCTGNSRRRRGTLFSCTTSWWQYFTSKMFILVIGMESLHPTYAYDHQKVNHSQNLIHPRTGCHTQLIESLWSHAKMKFGKTMPGWTILEWDLVPFSLEGNVSIYSQHSYRK